jgi:hypothetical protein
MSAENVETSQEVAADGDQNTPTGSSGADEIGHKLVA